ncbi:hypothetical protein NQD34_014641 [Periophthalmus magnuspinnatus]|nr:hypothetical protein NQD34_014641 [Periophthalmus magnuspinnatus]
MMTCVEKRHMSHRVGGMLHHRFPNGFTDLFMDETDREVSTLTDRAFRSLCIGDDAVYNDEFTYGYSPFSCHKPLAGEPHKKTAKETKKHGQSRSDKHESQPWKEHQQNTMSQMSSFLKALSATEESYGGMFKKNGVTDSNGESWDKSALRSIQKELSEFSTDYHTNLTEGHYKNHQRHPSGDVSTNKMGKDNSLSSGKSSKSKNVKTNVKLKKLNIKNFFLHSEFSPFQAWTDMNQFSFAQESIVSILPEDPVPKWFDLPFYKELTESPKKEPQLTEQPQPHQKAVTEPPPPPPAEPKPVPPPVPPKVLPKPILTTAEKRCTSECGDGSAAPWRRNRSRATSAVPINHPSIPSQDITKQVDENLLLLKKVDENLLLLKKVDENLTMLKKEARSVEVKTVEEVNSLASTPFSICQLMTPIIPSRQPTETSEILTVLSPSALELPLRPQSEAKGTPEPLKRDSYKSLASSILFNLKDNRKRVKSRYSPRKFKTLEETESGSPLSDMKQPFTEGLASGMSTPAIVKDVETVGSPILAKIQSVDLTKQDAERPLSNDYLLSHLLQSKAEEASPMSPLLQKKKNKSPLVKKQNYPSLNLYKKASPANSDMKYLQAPLSPGASAHTESVKDYLSPPPPNKDLSPLPKPKTSGLSPNTLNVSTDLSPTIPSPSGQKKHLSLQEKVVKRPPDVPEKPRRKNSIEPVSVKENNTVNQPVSAANVIKAAREAIHVAKHKALSPDSINKPTDEIIEVRNTEKQEQKPHNIMGLEESAIPENIHNPEKRKEPPPVPKRTFTKSDIQLPLDNPEMLTNGDLDSSKTDVKSKSQKEASQKQEKLKHIFSARQNNYIKNQRFAITDNDKEMESEESDRKVSARVERDEIGVPAEIRDSENIISDLNALKELERARLAERIYDNAKNKFGVVDIVEQTKARNDLISRELRNIKKGMMSMRGNTMAKRDLFLKKENEQSKGEVYSKLDGNVIVNKALINDNYDKAKMALEEIIFEREKRKHLPGQEESEQGVEDDSNVTKLQKSKTACDTEAKSNGLSASELKERLSELKDHTNMRQILSQTEPRPGETHRAGSRIALPGMDKTSVELNAIVKSKSEKIEKLISNYLTASSNVDSSHVSEETVENIVDENAEKKHDTPPVPPRSRKGSIRRDSVGKEAELSLKNVIGDLNKSKKDEKEELCLIPNLNSSEKQNVYDTEPTASLDNTKHINSKSALEPSISLSTKTSENETKSYSDATCENKKQMSPLAEIIPERKLQATGTGKVKRRAPLRPDHLSTSSSKDLVLEQTENVSISNEDSKPKADVVVESPPILTSPLLLVNGVSICQSPPDQASSSSKSSYFSAESTLHRNTETESNVYHSLENLIGEVEEVHEAGTGSLNKTRHNSDRTDGEYYSFSDHETEPEPLKRQIKSPPKDPVILTKETAPRSTKENAVKQEDETNSSASSNPVSPTFAIPALFKVKDNTFSNKLKKSTQPWSPRGSLAGIESLLVDNKIPQVQETYQEHVVGDATLPQVNIEVEEVLPSSPQLLLPTSSSEILKVQDNFFLRVPEQEDRHSGVSPLSEGVESTAASTVETADETSGASGLECEVSKVPSERSGSTCSGNDSQTGLPKPPAVLPKSEKAVLRAIKLTNRRMKKEEAHKSAQKSSHSSSSKHKSDRHKSDKSEQKSSSSSRKHKEKTHSTPPNAEEKSVHSSQNPNDIKQSSHRHSVDSEHKTGPVLLNERQGRSSDRRLRDKPEQRHYSSDRVISNVPVYKTYVGDRPRSDRALQRSLSTDRYMETKAERRLSADMSNNDRLDPRSQRIEKSIKDELQQRGRQKDKQIKESPLRRSHSIDSQSTNVLHPANLSRQSSITSQLSRQSSMEHTIVAPSFPMTQRKLLQDPDSGHYFFVDMPVQVKTKTFFDPETGTYVQLPVQPSEGAIPQPSPMEVLSPPLVVYHSFVPVSLSPMAQTAPVPLPHVEHEEYDPRHPDLMTRHTEAHSYLEPVFGQHEHMLGEFLGTEELDCPS